MPGVALFVDHENIFIGLKEFLGLRAPDRTDPAAEAAYQSHNQMLVATLASGLRREAGKLGPVRLAYAVANYSQFDFFHHPGIYAQFGFEPRFNVAGRNSADTFITNLVNEVLADPRSCGRRALSKLLGRRGRPAPALGAWHRCRGSGPARSGKRVSARSWSCFSTRNRRGGSYLCPRPALQRHRKPGA